MKSFRSWLAGLALGMALVCGVPSAKAQTVRGITYQGMLTQNGAPFSGIDSMTFIFSDKSGNILFSQIDPGVNVTNGIFNIVLGSFPESMKFDQQYSMTIVVTSNGSSTTLPAQLLWDAPYALNAERVAGIDVSATPVNGDIFPMPLSASGKIDPTMLPPISAGMLASNFIQTIDYVTPNEFDDFEIDGGTGVTITPGNHSITINAAELNPNLGVQSLTALQESVAPAITALDSETNGNAALMVQGGIAANNPSGTADGSGLNSGSPQTYWADEVSVPAATTTSLVIYNKLVSASSTILVTPVGIAAFDGGITITSQAAGTFTVTSKNPMGTGDGGMLTALNYIVVNH